MRRPLYLPASSMAETVVIGVGGIGGGAEFQLLAHSGGATAHLVEGVPVSGELRAGARLKLGQRWQGSTMVGFGVPFYDRGARVHAPR